MGDVVTKTADVTRPHLRQFWPLAAIVLVAIAISIAVHVLVFPAYSWNRDEPVYLWQVHALREGKVFTSGGGGIESPTIAKA